MQPHSDTHVNLPHLEQPFGQLFFPLEEHGQSKQRRGHKQHSRFFQVLTMLTQVLQAKDVQLYTHSYHVYILVSQLTKALHLNEKERRTIELAALFHDIGKITIHNTVLNKPSRLTQHEFDLIREHPGHGARIVAQSKHLKKVAPLIYSHHERWDGDGYPYRLREEAIPLGARIIAIVDTFDVITSQRAYKAASSIAQGLTELRRCAGTQFDPVLVNMFCTTQENALRSSRQELCQQIEKFI
ncbi:MAG: HD domain-containing protein [Chloroflexota bacterium]|nr:HD domain-containing protein [Chloroflexota bacterium]